MIRACKYLLVIVAGFAVLPAISQQKGPDTGPFSICGIVSGYQPGKAVYLALYSSERNFRTGKFTKAIILLKDTLGADSFHYCFTGVGKGEYMIAAFQDMNNDEKLNTGMFGRPVEPYRMFRPYKGLYSPTFEKCKFTIDSIFAGADIRFGLK